MSKKSEADEMLRLAVEGWLDVNGRAHPGEVLGDLVVIAHFRSYDADQVQVDDYELVIPDGVSYHAAYGLMHHAADSHAMSDEDDGDG